MSHDLSLGPVRVPLPHFDLPELDGKPISHYLKIPEGRGDSGFGRTYDTYLPTPIQMAAVTIEGAIRRAVDFVIPEESPTPDGKTVTTNLDRSFEATRAMIDEQAMIGNQDRFHSNTGLKVWRTEAWPLGQILHGRVFQAMQVGNWERVEGLFRELESYRLKNGFSGGVDVNQHRFYDDNAWIGLAATQAYNATNDARYLEHAKRTFEMVKSGAQESGGVYWFEQDKSSFNTCSAAPAGQLAIQLYEATKDPSYLKFAQTQSEWLFNTLRNGDDLYLDNISTTGVIERTIWTYNQGTPIGLNVQLYKATGDVKYLQRAEATAQSAIKHFHDDRLWKQPPVFNVVLFRNLQALHAVSPDQKYLDFIDNYLERVWNEARDPKNGLFSKGGIGSYERDAPGSVIDQGAIAQMYAARSLPPEKWGDLT